jgi:hypothetical protein
MDASVVADALGAEVTSAPIRDGHRFYVKRGDCTAKFDLVGDTVTWVSLRSPGGEGWMDTCMDFAHEALSQHGVKFVVADPRSKRTAESLKRRGFEGGDGRLLLRI